MVGAGLRLGSNNPAGSRGEFYPYGLEIPVLAKCWAETLSDPASEVGGAGQHWESKEPWISSMEGRLAGESRDKASQGHRNGLFQERAKLGAIGKMREERVWGAQPAESTAMCV